MTKVFNKEKLFNIIFKADTKAGKAFDIILLISIILSVVIVFLDSVTSLHLEFGKGLYIAEWFFTVIFTIEYILRIYAVRRKWRYIFSF